MSSPQSLLARALRDQEPQRDANAPGPVAAAVGGVFRVASRLRSARAFHPDGEVFEATLSVERPLLSEAGVPLLARHASHPAIVRLSRAAGFPQPLPDAHGLAVRVVDAHGTGLHQDFVLVSAVARHVLAPSRGFFSLPYSSLLFYRVGSSPVVVGALPHTEPAGGGTDFEQLERTAAATTVRFDLALARVLGSWRRIARLELGARVDHDEGERVRFNPWNTGGGIRPAGPLMRLREAAYRESQRGWSQP